MMVGYDDQADTLDLARVFNCRFFILSYKRKFFIWISLFIGRSLQDLSSYIIIACRKLGWPDSVLLI